ncbi:MAG: hypothetical protein AAGD05_05805 [Bacteroidota bacterium]
MLLCFLTVSSFFACSEEEVICSFIAEFVGTVLSFDTCVAILSIDIDQFFLEGENSESILRISGLENRTGTQAFDPNNLAGVGASFTDKATNMFYTTTSGQMEFTNIDDSDKLLDGSYNFTLASSAGDTMSVNGTFSNMPFEED